MSEPLLLGALLMGDPALLFALDPERRGSAWGLFEEYAPEAAVIVASAPWPEGGPIYASVGARITDGPLQRPVTQLVLPTERAALVLEMLDGGFPEAEFGAAEPCGEGCRAWPGAEIPQPIVALAEDAALRLVFPQGSAPLAPGSVQLLAPAEDPRATPSVQALLLPDTRSGALVRFEALQPWSLFQSAWEENEWARLGLDSRNFGILWMSTSEIRSAATPLLSAASSEFEDLLFRELDEHWEIVGTLSELGVALRPPAGPVELPAWRGPSPELSVTAARDLALGLTLAPPAFGIDPSAPDPQALWALERCGPGCALMLLGHPWSLLRSQTRGLLPGAEALPVGVMEGFGFHGALVEGQTVQGMSLSFSHRVRGGELSAPATGFEQRVWRRRHVQSGTGAPVKALFGGLEGQAGGVSLRSPPPPGGDLLAEVMTLASTPLFPITLGDLELRSEGAVFTALPPGIEAPALVDVAPRTPADLDAQSCARELGDLDPSGALLKGDAAQVAAAEARWREASPAVRARCERLRGEDPVVRWMLGQHSMIEALLAEAPGELGVGLDALGRACREGQALACGLLRALPAAEGVAALPPGRVSLWSLNRPWLIVDGGAAYPSGGARCDLEDLACVVEALMPEGEETRVLALHLGPGQDLDAARALLRALVAEGLTSVVWLTPEDRYGGLGPSLALMEYGPEHKARLDVGADRLRLDRRGVSEPLQAIRQREIAATHQDSQLVLELRLEAGLSLERWLEVLALLEDAQHPKNDYSALELSWPSP